MRLRRREIAEFANEANVASMALEADRASPRQEAARGLAIRKTHVPRQIAFNPIFSGAAGVRADSISQAVDRSFHIPMA
jgi:hypothetical protein